MSSQFKKLGIVKYVWLLQELVTRDLRVKYRRSVLGYIWSVLNPLLMMVVMTIVFSSLFRFDIPNYPLYLLCGQLLFNFFSDGTMQSMNSIINGASLIKKVYLPKYIFPVSRMLSSFVTMIFSMAALVIVMLATRAEFHVTLILVPVVLLYFFFFTLGIGMILSVMVVYFRDVEYLYGVFLSIFMYASPIMYPISIVPDWAQKIIAINPLTSYVDIFRQCVMYGTWPSIELHGICILCSLLAFLCGVIVFGRHENEFILYI